MFSLYCETLPALEFSPGVGKNRRIIFSLNFKSIGRFLYEPRGNAVFLGASLRRPCTLPVLPALKNRCRSMRIFPPITGASISVSTQPTSCSVRRRFWARFMRTWRAAIPSVKPDNLATFLGKTLHGNYYSAHK